MSNNNAVSSTSATTTAMSIPNSSNSSTSSSTSSSCSQHQNNFSFLSSSPPTTILEGANNNSHHPNSNSTAWYNNVNLSSFNLSKKIGGAINSATANSNSSATFTSSSSAANQNRASTTQATNQNHRPGDNTVEIDAAATFLTDIIKAAQFSDQSAENFRQALKTLLKQYYDGHWYPQEPLKGSGYRCLRVNGVMNPLLKKAAEMSGLPLKRFRHAFPVELTVWVDPGDVSVRFGEEGSIGVYYAKSGGNGLQHDHQQMVVDLQRLTAATAAPSHQQHHRRYSPQMVSNENQNVSNIVRGSSSSPYSSSQSSSTYIFSPYDGKSVRINSQSIVAGQHQPQPMTPSRKMQPTSTTMFTSAAALDQQRRTPPVGYAHQLHQQHPGSPHHQNLLSHMMFNGAAGGSPQQPMDIDSMTSSRRTPPHYQQQQQEGVFGGVAASDWLKNGDFQFYGNTHLGSFGQSAAVAAAAANMSASPFGRFARFMSAAGRQEPVGAN